jgi:hypothetical protein
MFRTTAVTQLLSAAVVLTAAAAPAFAQQTPYVAEVARESVSVRAQASGNHQKVGHLQRGDQVVVTRIVRDWAKIQLPSHFRIWISAKYVKQSGTTGTITASRLNLRPSAGLEGTPVGQATRGDIVRIYGKKNGFFEISPPKSASGWMFKSTLKYLKPGNGAKTRGSNAGTGGTTKTTPPPSKPAAPAKAVVDWVGKAWDAFTAAEKGEVGYRDFQGVHSYLNRAKSEGGSAQRIAALERRLGAAEAADTQTQKIEREAQVEIDTAKRKYESAMKRFDAVIKKMHEPKKAAPFTATGKFKALGMVWNRPGTHQMYGADGTRYFLKSVSVNLYKARWYGKKCGVRGQIVDLPGWGKVIEVHELVYLDNPKRK